MISCNLYDHIELVCLFRYPVAITLKSGEVVDGVALDTARNDQQQECIKIRGTDHNILIQLEQIATLTITTDNPHFVTVSFNSYVG